MRLIDADALDRAFTMLGFNDDKTLKHWGDRQDWCMSGQEVEDLINSATTIEPERKTGRWVEIALSNHTYKCSVCGRLLVNITDGKNNVAKSYPYCHCGAYMGGKQNEID